MTMLIQNKTEVAILFLEKVDIGLEKIIRHKSDIT